MTDEYQDVRFHEVDKLDTKTMTKLKTTMRKFLSQ